MLYELSKLLKTNLENAVCFKVGSHQYKLETPESDEDWTCVWFNPEEHLRVFKKFEESAQNETGDLKSYSLEFFAKLLVKGNPNLVELCFETPFFVADKFLAQSFPLNSTQSIVKEFLEGARPFVITRNLVSSYAGHLLHVKKEIGSKEITPKRLSHALRVGYSLSDLLQTQVLVPFRHSEHLEFVKQVKKGEVDLNSAFEVFNNLDREITLVFEASRNKFPSTEKLIKHANVFFLELFSDNF